MQNYNKLEIYWKRRGGLTLSGTRYYILKTEVGRCGNWDVLVANLRCQGVEVCFKHKGQTNEVQGVVFTMNGYRCGSQSGDGGDIAQEKETQTGNEVMKENKNYFFPYFFSNKS